MNTAKWQGYWEEQAGHLMWLVAAVWTILVGASLLSDLHRAREFALETGPNRGKSQF